MLPYILLIVIPYIIAFILFRIKKDEEIVRKYTFTIFFTIFFIILACRGLTVGNDLTNYKYYYTKCEEAGFKDILHIFGDEYFFYYLSWIISHLNGSFQILLIVIALVFTCVPLSILYKRESSRSILTIALFVGICPFAMYFSGLSQVTAMAFSVPIYYCCKNKKKWSYFVFTAIAYMFHKSAFMLLLMYPLYYIRFRKKHIPLIIAAIIVAYIGKKHIFTFMLRFAGKYNMYAATEETGSYTMLLLFLMLLAFCFILVPESKVDEQYIGMRNYLILIIFIQCFAPIHHLVMRLSYYYLLFVPVLISETIDRSSKKYRQIAEFASVVFIVFFTLYFFTLGVDADKLNIIPYIPFWKN